MGAGSPGGGIKTYQETLLGDVLPRMDLSFVRHVGRHDVYLCPLCGDEDGHLYINKETGLWDCKACGEVGNPLTLYSKACGTTYSDAYKIIHNGARLTGDGPSCHALPNLTPEAPIARRDAVYRDFLSKLPLYLNHAQDLKRRGFTREQALQNLYRSLPNNASERGRIAGDLAQRHDLTGVRGFRQKNGAWECYYTPGYTIPVVNARGQIQAMQIRRDSNDPKYVYFGYRDSGIDNSTPVHVVNPDIAHRTGSAWATEGALKADSAAKIMGDSVCFIASPGVSSWRALLPVLDELHVNKVVQAFDKDQDYKPPVAKCVICFEEAVICRMSLHRALWPPGLGKGIDDAQLSIKRRVERKEGTEEVIIRETTETEIIIKRTLAARQ